MTTFKKVKAGTMYKYDPVMIDRVDPRLLETIKPGDVVEVVKLNGCPPPNTMGHCHIKKDGKFIGLVCTNSLKPLRK